MAISPHFHVHLHASNSCNAWRCCIDDPDKKKEHKHEIKNRRMVPISDTAIAPENHSNGCWSAMKRALCCCCVTSDAEHNEKAVTIYRNYLVQEYGPAAAGIAPELAAISVDEKLIARAALYTREVQAIAEQAIIVRDNWEKLTAMINHLKYYGLAEAHKESSVQIVEIPTPRTPSTERSADSKAERGELIVRRSNGTTEPMDPEKLRKAITYAPTTKALEAEQVENMMENIKASLEQLEGEEVSSRTILGLVVQELMGRGFEIKAPECLNQVPHSVRQDLTSKSAKGTLEAKERAILLSTLTGQSPQGEAPSGSVPDAMEIDID